MPWPCNRKRAEWRKRRKQNDKKYRKRLLETRASQKRVRRLLPHLIARNGNLCALCGVSLPSSITPDTHVDHIVPRSKGGGDVVSNLQAVHAACNLRKGRKIAP